MLIAEAAHGPARTSCSASGASSAERMPASRYHANRIGSRALSWFIGVAGAGHAVRVPAVHEPTRCGASAAEGARLRDRNGNARQAPAARRPHRQRADHRGVRRPAQQAATGARHDQDLFSRGVLPLSGADSDHHDGSRTYRRVPRRWTLHGLNSGPIFAATYHGVRLLPRSRLLRHRPRRILDGLAADDREQRRACRQPASASSPTSRRSAAAARAGRVSQLHARRDRLS